MELIRQLGQQKATFYGQVECAIFDLVAQMLAILLEKYDAEIIIELNDYCYADPAKQESDSMVEIIIACEEMSENSGDIEITLCGEVQCRNHQHESFTLLLSLCSKNNFGGLFFTDDPLENKDSVRFLLLQFGRKAEQLSDSIFKVALIHKEFDTQQQIIGEGRGLLVFGREQSCASN